MQLTNEAQHWAQPSIRYRLSKQSITFSFLPVWTSSGWRMGKVGFPGLALEICVPCWILFGNETLKKWRVHWPRSQWDWGSDWFCTHPHSVILISYWLESLGGTLDAEESCTHPNLGALSALESYRSSQTHWTFLTNGVLSRPPSSPQLFSSSSQLSGKGSF